MRPPFYEYVPIPVVEARWAWDLFQYQLEDEAPGSMEFIPASGGTFLVWQDGSNAKGLPLTQLMRRRRQHEMLQQFKEFIVAGVPSAHLAGVESKGAPTSQVAS